MMTIVFDFIFHFCMYMQFAKHHAACFIVILCCFVIAKDGVIEYTVSLTYGPLHAPNLIDLDAGDAAL